MFATRAAKPFGPPLARKISGAGRLVWKLSLKFYQSARMIGHESPPNSVCSLFVLRDRSHPVTTYCGTGTKGISLQKIYEKLRYHIVINDEPLFWLQYSILMTEKEDLIAAEEFLHAAYSRASAIDFRTYQIDTHACRLLLL